MSVLGATGTGRAVGTFTTTSHRHTAQRMVASPSRDAGRLRRLCPSERDRTLRGLLRLVVEVPRVVVLITTPHPINVCDAMQALEAGKHVLRGTLLRSTGRGHGGPPAPRRRQAFSCY